ncbi:hypothetical protein FHS41_000260 [Streptomyces violarus]|uniref:Uncharacterized protein n=1 Tax=Streptomyces violarus TaxID=67380 RepID=A0A7W4ZJU8_9ACTN|nr:hypothetical protein [Streptomyces violarus]MBB3073791.1 hypothetical protein [Streptomyces violarus]
MDEAARPAVPVLDPADQESSRPAAPASDEPDVAFDRSAAPGSGTAAERSAARGPDRADQEPARSAALGSDDADRPSAAPAASRSNRVDPPSAQPAASGPHQADRPSDASVASRSNQVSSPSAEPAVPGPHQADRPPAAPADLRKDLVDSTPARLDRTGPVDPAPGEAAQRGASAPGEAEQSGARPFVIRSLDDNPVELRPGTGPAPAPYGDAVSDLVHAAVADRPLEEVVALITSLEKSPDHAEAMVDALRTAGVERRVEDVSRMIALLTRPPRDADSADEAIRAAAAHRPVEEVTRLVVLLHKEPQMPHVREEALRAAATGRSVGELVELIDRLGLERLDRNGRVPTGTERPEAETAQPVTPARPARRREIRRTLDSSPSDRDRATERLTKAMAWSSWLTALALAVCAVAHFPLQRGGASLDLHAVALGLSVLCTVLALLLALRPVAPVLVGAVVVPTVLAGAQAYGSSFPSASLTRAVDLALAPPWFAAGAAVCTALLALVALVFRAVAPFASGQWSPLPATEARGMAE